MLPEQKYKIKQKECNGKSCPHLQRISMLNEVLNYMMNHIKGYYGYSIRPNSWFTSQIEKYGQKYEEKLLNEEHLLSKIQNRKLIVELCSKESSVSRVVQ